MRPLRSKKTYHTVRDNTGQNRVWQLLQEDDILSDEGSVDSVSVQESYFLECGCNAPPAGRCYQCGAQSCEAHCGICLRCRKPICPECSIFTESGRWCGDCLKIITRENRNNKIKRFFLSFFFDMED